MNKIIIAKLLSKVYNFTRKALIIIDNDYQYKLGEEVIMKLDKAEKGQMVEIVNIPDASIRAQAIRLGICEGARLICAEKLPAGPIVLQNRMQEVAIGRRLAETIEVKAV